VNKTMFAEIVALIGIATPIIGGLTGWW